MKQVIYLDVLIFLNMIITFLLLLAAASVMKQYPAAKRMVLACIEGGVSSLIILAPEMGFALSLLVRLLISVIIVASAYKPKTLRLLAKQTAYFFTVNFIFAGVMLFASSLPGISIITYQNGTAYINLSFFSLIAASVICYCVTALLNRLSRHKGAHCQVHTAELSLGGRSVRCPAIADTGNALKDPYTGRSVIVADKSAISEILPESVNAYLEGNAAEGIRLIPCRTVAGTSLLPCFRADTVTIKTDNGTVFAENEIIAVSNQRLTEIILPVSLFSERSNRNAATEHTGFRADKKHNP